MDQHPTAEDLAKNWSQFDHGATIGQRGSEDGIILRDEEHSRGARITLERDTAHAPFAITCGVYGSMVHTAFAGGEIEANGKYDEMKVWLEQMLADGLSEDEYLKRLSEFVDKF
jgi:hypothetical protein